MDGEEEFDGEVLRRECMMDSVFFAHSFWSWDLGRLHTAYYNSIGQAGSDR